MAFNMTASIFKAESMTFRISCKYMTEREDLV